MTPSPLVGWRSTTSTQRKSESPHTSNTFAFVLPLWIVPALASSWSHLMVVRCSKDHSRCSSQTT